MAYNPNYPPYVAGNAPTMPRRLAPAPPPAPQPAPAPVTPPASDPIVHARVFIPARAPHERIYPPTYDPNLVLAMNNPPFLHVPLGSAPEPWHPPGGSSFLHRNDLPEGQLGRDLARFLSGLPIMEFVAFRDEMAVLREMWPELRARPVVELVSAPMVVQSVEGREVKVEKREEREERELRVPVVDLIGKDAKMEMGPVKVKKEQEEGKE